MLAFSVAVRLREIAIRTALGAERRAIVWSVFRPAIAIASAGAVGGGVLALVGAPWLRATVSGAGSADPRLFVAAVLVLAFAAAAAALGPARRALDIDPAVALRGD